MTSEPDRGQRNWEDKPEAPDANKRIDAELARSDQLLKIVQVARMANVSERTVWRDIQKGTLRVSYSSPGRPRVAIIDARTYARL
jgi:hypothetical protein